MELHEIYEEVLTKVNERKFETPTTDEEYAHNGALDRVTGILKNYVKCEGLFQIGKDGLYVPCEDMLQIYSWVRCESVAGKCLFCQDLASLAHNNAIDVALAIVNYVMCEKKES